MTLPSKEQLQIEFLTALETILSNSKLINRAITEYANGNLTFSELGNLSTKSKGYEKAAQYDEHKKRWNFYETHFGLKKSSEQLGTWMTLQEEITFYAVFQEAKKSLQEKYPQIDWHDQIAKAAASHISTNIESLMKKEKNKFMLIYGNNPEVSSLLIDACANEKKKIQEAASRQEEREVFLRPTPIQKESKKLILAIQDLEKNYRLLGKSHHKKDIANLIKKAKNIYNPNETDTQKQLEQYQALLNTVEDAFKKEQKHFCKPFLRIGEEKNPSAFATAIREDQNNHHYARLLACIINHCYQSKFTFINDNNTMEILTNQCIRDPVTKSITLPESNVYTAIKKSFLIENREKNIRPVKK